MVGDRIKGVVTDDGVHCVYVASEHLVKVAALAVRLGATWDRRCKGTVGECLADLHDMVVEVATDHDWGVRILLGDVLGDLDDSPGSILQLLLLPWFQVAVEYLYGVTADLQLRPA